MKILMISYYSIPLNSVSSYRINSFCEQFTAEGADVTLLTRHWDETFTNWNDILKSNTKETSVIKEGGFRTIRLPYKTNFKNYKFSALNKLNTSYHYFFGNLQPEINPYKDFKTFALQLLQDESDFDLIFVSCPPNNLAKLAYYLNKKTGIPFVIDFRDFFNRKYLISYYKENQIDRIIRKISVFYLKKWTRNCSLISTVSPRLQSVFDQLFQKKTTLVLNGFESLYFTKREQITIQNEVFTIRYIGTAYEQQNFDIIIAGIQHFQKKHPAFSLKIELVGLHMPKIEKLFQKNFSKNTLKIYSSRIPKEQVVLKTINSDILLLPWNDFHGVYGTKVFDYLASGSHILLAPSDHNVVQDLVTSLNAGSICDSKEDVYECLSIQYQKWKSKKDKKVINPDIYNFSREKISKDFYSLLKKKID